MTTNLRLAVGTLALAAGAFGWHEVQVRGEPTYDTVPVERGDLSSLVTANGTCTALVTVQVGSQVSGNIKALYADFNSHVTKGQLIAEIDPGLFQAKVDQAQAAVDSANASVTAARASATEAEIVIRGARAQKTNQQAALELAKSVEHDALLKLQARQKLGGIESPEDLSTAQTTYDVAKADREAAEAQLRAADALIESDQSQYASTQAQVTEAIEQVKQAVAVLDQAKLDLAHTRITAPIDGVVLSRDIDVGQTVAASFQSPTLFEIAQDLRQMQVDMNVDESDVSRLRNDEKATFTVDALPGYTFDATVKEVRRSPVNIQNVITYDAILTVLNPDAKLFPGMTANVRVLAGVHANVLKVRNGALRYQPLGTKQPPKDVKMVYVLDSTHKITPRKVETGLADGTYTEILSGDVHEGDQVVIAEHRR